MIEFKPFSKIPRMFREIVITEKIDGTNSSIYIGEDGSFLTASRNRWITTGDDNYGFSRWAHENKKELLKLGPGHHFGEWWGKGIQRGYGLQEKRFSLFNVSKWSESRPSCCHVVPVLYVGQFDSTRRVKDALSTLETIGSVAAPGFMDPEGVIVYHTAAGNMFKATIKNDESPKGLVK